MTGSIISDDYAEFLAKEYLLDYVSRGGAAVKFCVGTAPALSTLKSRLGAIAGDNNYLHATIADADAKVSMTDQILFALTRSLDLVALAGSITNAAYQHIGFAADDSGDLRLGHIAAHHQVDPGELHRSVRRRLEQTLLADQLLRDLRLAVFRLAQYHLGAGDVSDLEATAIVNWLRGQPAHPGALRSSGIRYRINRGSAHRLLVAMPSLVAGAGHRGLIINLDLSRVGADRPKGAGGAKGTDDAFYYGKVARLDAYEVLRQLVDSTDTLRHCLLVVTVPIALFDDTERGPLIYQALAMRLVDDVADRKLPNPLAAVVRVG